MVGACSTWRQRSPSRLARSPSAAPSTGRPPRWARPGCGSAAVRARAGPRARGLSRRLRPALLDRSRSPAGLDRDWAPPVRLAGAEPQTAHLLAAAGHGRGSVPPPRSAGAALSARPSGEMDRGLDEAFALSAALGEAGRLTVTHGWSLQGQFGLEADEADPAPGLLTGSVGLALLGACRRRRWHGAGAPPGRRLVFARRAGKGRAGRPAGSGLRDNTVMLGELVRVVNDRWRFGMQFGQLGAPAHARRQWRRRARVARRSVDHLSRRHRSCRADAAFEGSASAASASPGRMARHRVSCRTFRCCRAAAWGWVSSGAPWRPRAIG